MFTPIKNQVSITKRKSFVSLTVFFLTVDKAQALNHAAGVLSVVFGILAESYILWNILGVPSDLFTRGKVHIKINAKNESRHYMNYILQLNSVKISTLTQQDKRKNFPPSSLIYSLTSRKNLPLDECVFSSFTWRKNVLI